MSRLFTAIDARELRIPFTTSFRHASAERSETASIWVTARTAGGIGYGESCPRPYVTGETTASALEFCAAHGQELVGTVTDLSTLQAWMRAHAADIDAQPAAWCALELALLDVLARVRGRTVEQLLGLGPLASTFRYSAVIGDMEPEAFASMAARYQRAGFTDVKIKLSGDLTRDRAKVDALRALAAPPVRVRADANNLWPDARSAIGALRTLDAQFWGVEEPVTAEDYRGLLQVADALRCFIVLDESVIRASQLEALPASAWWIVNVRVSKMGGLLRALDVVRTARARGIGVIVGAQVGETSLLTRAALTVAQAAGNALRAQEGAFGTQLLQHDVVEPPLMFGTGGILTIAGGPIHGPGFGLTIDEQAVQ